MITAGLLSGWKLESEGVILPEERLPAAQTIILGVQHVVAMFGGTVLAAILMGFDPNVVVLFSGIGTLIFFIVVGGHVPSYLGSSFSFIAVVIAATAYAGPGPNPNVGIALGGIMAAGMLYALIGFAVVLAGHSWVEKLLPPVVSGAVIAAIGLNLAPVAVKAVSGSTFDTAVAIITVATISGIAVFAPRFWQRIPILIGGAFGYLVHWILANGLGLGMPIDFRHDEGSRVRDRIVDLPVDHRSPRWSDLGFTRHSSWIGVSVRSLEASINRAAIVLEFGRYRPHACIMSGATDVLWLGVVIVAIFAGFFFGGIPF